MASASKTSDCNGSAASDAAPAVRRHRRSRGRALNLRLLAVTLLVTAAGVPAVYFWHSYQLWRNAAALISQADGLEAEGKWPQAVTCFNRYLALRPDDVSARARLAKAFDQTATTAAQKGRAAQLYLTAIALAAPQSPSDLRLRHVELLLESQQHSGALTYADEFLTDFPEDAAAQRVKALALLALWRNKTRNVGEQSISAPAVFEALEAASRKNPADPIVASELARFCRTQLHQLPALQRQANAAANQETLAARIGRLYPSLELQGLTIEDGEQLADAVMDRLVDAGRRDPLAWLARFEYRREFELPGGNDDLDRAVAVDANKESFPVRFAAGMRARDVQQWKLAEEYFQQAVAIHPADRRGHLWLGQSHADQQDLARAIDAWQLGLERLGASDLELQTLVASALVRSNRLPEAQAVLQDLEERAKRALGPDQQQWLAACHVLQADIAEAAKDYHTAATQLTRALVLRQAGPQSVQRAQENAALYVRLGGCYRALQRWDQAALAYESAAGLLPLRPGPRLMAAAAWEAAGRIDEAARQYEDGLSLPDALSNPESVAQFWVAFAGCLFRLQLELPETRRNWSDFEQALERAESLAREAESAELTVFRQMLRAEYEARQGQVAVARERFRDLEPLALADTDMAARLARNYERIGLPDEADRVVQTLRQQQAGSAEPLLLDFDLLTSRNRFEEAQRRLLADLPSLSAQGRRRARISLAVAQITRSNNTEARTQLTRLLANDASYRRARQLRDELEKQTAQGPERDERDREFQTHALRLRLDPAYQRALQLLAEMAIDRMRGLKGDALAEASKSAARFERDLKDLIEGDEGVHWRYYRAMRLFNRCQALDKDPRLVEFRKLQKEKELLRTTYQGQRTDELRKLQTRIDRLAAEAQPLDDRLAALFREARQLQREIGQLRPGWAPAYLLEARLAQVAPEPNFEAAIRAYEQAIRLGESRLRVYEELILLLYQRDRIAEADIYLSRLREKVRLSRSLFELALTIDERLGNLPLALEAARREVEQQPDDALSHLRLGQLLALDSPADATAREDRLLEAESELRRARQLAPKNASCWSALLSFYTSTQQLDASRELLAELEQATDLDSQEDRLFLLAQGYQLLGDAERAESFYRTVTSGSKNAAVLVQAAGFFFKSDPDSAQRMAWEALKLDSGNRAAQELYAVLGVRDASTDEQVYEALSHLSDRGPSAVGNSRLKALLYLSKGGKVYREQARKILEGLVNVRDWEPIDKLLLARLYTAQGKVAKAREQLIDIVNHQGRAAAPDVLAESASLLLETAKDEAELGDAEQVWQRLAEIEPAATHLRTLELRARFLNKTGQEAQVPPLIAAHLEETLPALADDAQRARRLVRVADLYASLEMHAAAEPVYRQAVGLESSMYPPLALWLTKQGRSGEAVEMCLQAAAADTTPRAAITLATVLTIGQPDDAARQSAENVLAQAMELHPRHVGLLIIMGSARLMEGRTGDAIRVLQQALDSEPGNVQALNNLAVLLAHEPQQRNKALQLINQAMQIAGQKPELVDTKGLVLLEQGELQDAVEAFQEALSLSPGDAGFRFHLALAYRQQGKLDEARQALKRARNLGLAVDLLSPMERSQLSKLEEAIR